MCIESGLEKELTLHLCYVDFQRFFVHFLYRPLPYLLARFSASECEKTIEE